MIITEQMHTTYSRHLILLSLRPLLKILIIIQVWIGAEHIIGIELFSNGQEINLTENFDNNFNGMGFPGSLIFVDQGLTPIMKPVVQWISKVRLKISN